MPPMLGPVISHSRSLGPSDRSLATNRSPPSGSAASTTGWRAADLEAGLVGQLRAAPFAFRRALGMACRDVDPGDRFGGAGICAAAATARRQLLGMRSLGGERVAAGLDHPARFRVQFGRVEAHHAGQRLAVGEAAVGRHQPVGVPRGTSI